MDQERGKENENSLITYEDELNEEGLVVVSHLALSYWLQHVNMLMS